ncbi:MAG: hypothetical protein U0939_21920 [Pirellulales bacterium]
MAKRIPAVNLTATVPRCPRCGAVAWRAYKTRPIGDDVKVRYSKCGSCNLRAVVTVQPQDGDDANFHTNNW